LVKCPAWILNKLRKEHRQNKENIAKIHKLKTKLHNERDAHRQWKEEASEFMDAKYHNKEKVLLEREKTLEETIRRMTIGTEGFVPISAKLASLSPPAPSKSTETNK
jgi:hypothetical protein